jgi:hypothetical protein
MAATKRNAMLIAEARHKIRTTQLINRLQNHALGIGHEMSLSQIKATEILLRKSVPDLMRAEVTGKDGGPMEYRIDTPAKETREEWLARHEAEDKPAVH